MKVLTIVTVNFGVNGISNVVKNYYEFLNKDLVEMDFVLLNEPTENFKNDVLSNNGKIFVSYNRLKKPLSYFVKLQKIIKNEKYDIIHVHGNSNTMAIELVAAKLAHVNVRFAHAHTTMSKFPIIHKALQIPFNKSYTHGISCGIDAGKWLFKNKDFEVIDNGVNVNLFKFSLIEREIIRNELNLLPEDKVIGHVGAFNEEKNQKYFLELFKWLKNNKKDYKLILVGEGPLKIEIEKKVIEQGLENEIKFVGNRLDIPKLMSAFDLFMMPSLYEGLPLTLVEAQSSDLPCFVSDSITSEVKLIDNFMYFNLNESFESTEKKMESCFVDDNFRSERIGNKKISNSKYNVKEGSNKLEKVYKVSLKSKSTGKFILNKKIYLNKI